MNWEQHRQDLQNGKTVEFRPKGNSMSPKIESGQLVTVEPVVPSSVKKNDIVFCKVNGNFYVHLVTAVQVKMGGIRFQIGNNKGRTNGWIFQDKVFGKVTKVSA